MADKMMRIAARKPNGTATAVSTDANGRIITNRAWKRKWSNIDSLKIRDTSYHDVAAVDLRDVPMYSLRVQNQLGVPVTLYLKTDVNTTNGYAITNKDGQVITFTIQPTNNYTIITPEDLPILKYVQYLRIAVAASSTPESGSIYFYMVEMS